MFFASVMLVLLATFSLFFQGCGVKGEPIPYVVAYPEKPQPPEPSQPTKEKSPEK